MKYEDLMKLENGTLMKIKGKGAFGETNILIHLKKENLKNFGVTGYMLGSTLYPYEWLYLATHEDYEEAISKAKINYEERLKDLEKSFKKSEKARATKVLVDLKKKAGK